jgi:type VI secretion system protein ImpC
MSDTPSVAPAPETVTEAAPAAAPGLLEQIIATAKEKEQGRTKDLVRALITQVEANTVKFEKNLSRTIDDAVARIDRLISAQLNEIMHNERFLKLEGSWRGLQYLVKNSPDIPSLKIQVLNASKKDLFNDLTRSDEFDQSHLWKVVYESGFGQAGGEPFGALVGDYEWDSSPDDIDTLQLMAGVASAAFAPVLSAASPELLGLSSWTELNKPRDLTQILTDSSEYTKWRMFRDSDDARYVALALPRVLARRPYGGSGVAVEAFNYIEAPVDESGAAEDRRKKLNVREMDLAHDHYCWMNAAYALGTRLTNAFADYGFCTAIRGEESGGKVENLPLHGFETAEGDHDNKCPTEVSIPERRDGELSRLGFMPLVHYKNTDYAVFYSAQTTQKPKKYESDDDNANAEITARLPYVMATGRFAHFLKVMARGKIGGFMEASDCEIWLNRWINKYVNSSAHVGETLKAEYPLRSARVEVRDIPGQPGAYTAVALLQPWMQMEELNASLRMVMHIPKNN